MRKKRERAQAGVRLPDGDLNGYTLLLLGREYTLRVQEREGVGFDQATGQIFLPAREAEKRLVQWLKENAKQIFTRITEEQAKRMGVRYRSVGVSSAKTRWGSCSADDRLRYSFRLLYAPKEVIEYVVVHELAHTRYKNHSRLFWAEVEKYLPDWKIQRKWLKAHGALMEIF